MKRKIPLHRIISSLVIQFFTGTRVQRFLFMILRRFAPILIVGKRVIVTRSDDVKEVLTRDHDFTIREINGPRMDRMHVHFFLGMDRSSEHDREKAMMESVVLRTDLEKIRTIVKVNASQLVDSLRLNGEIDVVNNYGRKVPIRLIEEYFGVPGPDDITMMHWMRILFQEIFLNPTDNEKILKAASQAAAELEHHMNSIIARKKREMNSQTASDTDDVLKRLLLHQARNGGWPDDNVIRRNVCGLILGAAETTNKAVTQIIDVLLDHPEQFRSSVKAALANDIETVSSFSFEALRFNPHNPIISRYSKEQHIVAEGTTRKKIVPEQSTVYAATLSAMFDPLAFETPSTFIPDRKNEYLHFGYGLHQCFGRYINGVQIPELVAALLRLKNLRRAFLLDGLLIYDGPFPDRLILNFN